MIKNFLRAFYSDLLYDLYEAKTGKLHLFRDVFFHYGVWLFGFLGIHFVISLLYYFVWITDWMEFYQRVISFGIVTAILFSVWIFAGILYGTSPDRPIVEGINDETKIPKWLR